MQKAVLFFPLSKSAVQATTIPWEAVATALKEKRDVFVLRLTKAQVTEKKWQLIPYILSL